MKLFLIIFSFSLMINSANACDGKKAVSKDAFYNDKVEVTTLLKSSESWDGVKLPAYPKGEVEIQVLQITIPPKMTLPVHFHPVINTGILVKGTMRLNTVDGKSRLFKAGDVFNEVVGTHHYCENMGNEPVLLYVYYVSEKGGKPLTILANSSTDATSE
ncbi:MAG: cupin domain-containing protein [Cellvibrionales bacterium]|nr:cupin domain-containing protein [Cellvibrionales bacterium]